MRSLAVALALVAQPLLAQQAQTPPPAQAAPPEAVKPPPDDFDLLPPEKKSDPAALAKEAEVQRDLGRRRTMLQLHQVFGFATLASLGATVVLGQLNYADKYGGGGDSGRYITAHSAVAYGAAGIFAATGLLALLAPSPFDKPLRLDTATLHKTSMAVATAGMAAEIVLGIVAARKEGHLSQRDFALAHQIIGYTAAVSTAGGFIAITW